MKFKDFLLLSLSRLGATAMWCEERRTQMQYLFWCEGDLLRIPNIKWRWQNRTKDELNWEKLNQRAANLNMKGGQQGEHAGWHRGWTQTTRRETEGNTHYKYTEGHWEITHRWETQLDLINLTRQGNTNTRDQQREHKPRNPVSKIPKHKPSQNSPQIKTINTPNTKSLSHGLRIMTVML